MAFADNQQRSRTTSIAAVALVHVAIGYAFVSGLAQTVWNKTPEIIQLIPIAPDKAPPPPDIVPQAKPDRPDKVTTVDRVIAVDTASRDDFVAATDDPPFTQSATTDSEPTIAPPPPIVSKAQSAGPATPRAGWITTDDYPASAIRAEAEGTVAITVAVDDRGRVMACSVTGSSGNEALDAATCRLYPRRARFTPALNDAGQPVPTTYNDRVRWQLPK